MPEIVVTEFMDTAPLDALSARYELVYDPELVNDRARLLALAADCRALIVRNRTEVREDLLESCRNLQVIGRLGVGLDNIDLEACRARNIEVYPAVGTNEVSVAEYVIAAILLLLRGAFFASDRVLSGQWPRRELVGFEAFGRRLGLVGYGRIARLVARRADALGMEVLAFDPHIDGSDSLWENEPARRCDLEPMLRASQVISVHAPLSRETRGLVGRDQLASMAPEAYLINTARGGIVDEEALATALRHGELAGAAVDVFEREPLPANSLWRGVPNVILTPHIAGVTRESNRRISEVTVENVGKALERLTKSEAR